MLHKKTIKKIVPKQRVKVSLFIVGAQKAGTSALHNYLIKHPKVQGGIKKEINFFNHKEKYEQGEEWYHKQFKSPLFYQPKSIYLDSTPAYLNNLTIAEQIYNYNPNATIVILLRDPVSRAFSAWNMYKQFSELNERQKSNLINTHIEKNNEERFKNLINQNPFPDFSRFISNELINNKLVDVYPNILKRSLYYDQVKTYYNLFNTKQIFVFESNYFKSNKLEVTNQIFNALGLQTFEESKYKLEQIHAREYNSKIDKETKKKLKEFYKPHNENLFQLINQRFDW